MAHAAKDTTKPKRFRLNMVNAAEDVPRLVRAYGRACMGEFALVLRPREQRGVLVLMTKKDGARVWRSGDPPVSDRVRATARIEGKRLRIETGPHAGVSFHAMNTEVERAIRGREGERVEVQFVPDDQFAETGRSARGRRRARHPRERHRPDEAVKLVEGRAEGPRQGQARSPAASGRLALPLLTRAHPRRAVPQARHLRRAAPHRRGRRGLGLEGRPHEKWFSQPGRRRARHPTCSSAIEAACAPWACWARPAASATAAAPPTTAATPPIPVKPAREGRGSDRAHQGPAGQSVRLDALPARRDAPESEEIA